MRTARSTTRARAGFTLIEVLVVVVILAVLASMAVPRLTGTTRRQFELTVDQVSDLLLMFAQRDQLGTKPVGLRYDPEHRWLQLVVLDSIPGDPESLPSWRTDMFVPPVKLPLVVDHERLFVYADRESVDIREWPLSNKPGEARPAVEIEMHSIDGDLDATLTLEPHAVSPSRRGQGRRQVAQRSPVDLDAAGRSREDW